MSCEMLSYDCNGQPDFCRYSATIRFSSMLRSPIFCGSAASICLTRCRDVWGETNSSGYRNDSGGIRNIWPNFTIVIRLGNTFIDKLTRCFTEGQTDEELIVEVNTTFGTNLNPDDFSAIMNYANHQLVEVAKSQVGNVGGEPYWSWYGFGGRVEWCACFVSWCADQCGYIDRGIIPKFAGCGNGVDWFKAKNQWLDGSATPESGNIIFFDWKDENGIQDGNSDHVGIVEKVEGGRVYTIEGNSGDACQQNSYPVGYYEILGYGTPSLF